MDDRVVIMPYERAVRFQKRYCCAGCWGHLNVYAVPESREVRISCGNCGDGRGFVTKRYAEGRRQESKADAMDVHVTLTAVGILPRRSEAQLLKELGGK